MGSERSATLGEQAERRALEFLVDEGLTPLTRNFHSRGGEIDLVMLHGDCLVFIEVRFRSSSRFANPELTVDPRKQRKILRTAAMFIATKPAHARHSVRFDVVAITAGDSGGIRWIQDAFRPRDSTL